MSSSNHHAADFSARHSAAMVPTDPRWRVDVAEMIDQVGSTYDLVEDRPAPRGLDTPVAEIHPDAPIRLQLRIDTIHEGLVVAGTATATMHAVCSRCLDPIETELTAQISELFELEPQLDTEPEEQRLILNGGIDLELPVRNALLDGFPFQPVCKPDCLGLCDQCGIRLEDAEEGHHHEQLDPRWAALAGLTFDEDDEPGATINTQQ